MPVTYQNIPPDQLRETLLQLIHSSEQSRTHSLVQAELERAALQHFEGEEHEHRYENIVSLEREAEFENKKIEVAKAKLAELD